MGWLTDLVTWWTLLWIVFWILATVDIILSIRCVYNWMLYMSGSVCVFLNRGYIIMVIVRECITMGVVFKTTNVAVCCLDRHTIWIISGDGIGCSSSLLSLLYSVYIYISMASVFAIIWSEWYLRTCLIQSVKPSLRENLSTQSLYLHIIVISI